MATSSIALFTGPQDVSVTLDTLNKMIIAINAIFLTDTGSTFVGPTLVNPVAIQDATDTTKQLKFSLSGLTTAVTDTFTFTNASNAAYTFPAATDTLVGRASTDTLTNKTLTAPIISTISNTGTLTLPTSTDTLVGRATTDTLTNKTLTAPIINTGTLAGGIYTADTNICTTQNSTTSSVALTNIVGMVQTVVTGSYLVEIVLQMTSGASGGAKIAFNFTTATLSSTNTVSAAYATTVAPVLLFNTTTTNQTSLIAYTGVTTFATIQGNMIFSAGGTAQLQAAQNASNGTATVVVVGSYMKFTRYA